MARPNTRALAAAPRPVHCRDCGQGYVGAKAAHRVVCVALAPPPGAPAPGGPAAAPVGVPDPVLPQMAAAVEPDGAVAAAVKQARMKGAATCIVASNGSVTFPMADGVWQDLYAATKLVWDEINLDLVEASKVSVAKQPSRAVWGSALAVAQQATSPQQPSRLESGEPAPKRPQFLSQGLESESDKAVVFVPKPAAGFLEAYIGTGGDMDSVRYSYPPTTQPVCDHMLACQHSGCDDVAVFNCSDAMTAFTGTLTTVVFGETLEAVRQVLRTGRVDDIMLFCKDKELRTQLAGLQIAVATLTTLFRTYYGVTCTLLQPLIEMRDTPLLQKEYAVALELAKAAGYSTVDAQQSAAAYLIRQVNMTMRQWQEEAMEQLVQHFKKPNIVTDEASGHTFRRVGAKRDFDAPNWKLIWSAVKADNSKVTPKSSLHGDSHGGVKSGGQRSAPLAGSGGQRNSKTDGRAPAWVALSSSDVAAAGLPKELAALQAKGYKDALASNERRWLFRMKLDGKDICLRNFFSGCVRETGGCPSPCAATVPRDHVFKTQEAFTKKLGRS